MSTFDLKDYPLTIDGDPVTNLKVMQSAAGYYIGRGYFDTEIGYGPLPYSRESGYYATKEQAQADLENMAFEVRDCVENNWAYAEGGLPHPKG